MITAATNNARMQALFAEIAVLKKTLKLSSIVMDSARLLRSPPAPEELENLGFTRAKRFAGDTIGALTDGVRKNLSVEDCVHILILRAVDEYDKATKKAE